MSKKISELPEYIGAPQPTGSLPISIGGTTYKIDPSLLFVANQNPNPDPDTVVSLNQNNVKEILNIVNDEINGGFINYVLTDEDNNIRTGTIHFTTSTNGEFSFYEDIMNKVGQTYDYIFSMTNNGTNTSFRFYNNSGRKASVTFQKKLMINPNS
jgi:hypothetical protein